MRDPVKQTVLDFIRESRLLIFAVMVVIAIFGFPSLIKFILPPPLPPRRAEGKVVLMVYYVRKFSPEWGITVRLNDGKTQDFGVDETDFTHCHIGDTVYLNQVGLAYEGVKGPFCNSQTPTPIAGSH